MFFALRWNLDNSPLLDEFNPGALVQVPFFCSFVKGVNCKHLLIFNFQYQQWKSKDFFQFV